jgi:LysM repeat protein
MGRAIGRVLAPIGTLGLIVLVLSLLGSSELLAGQERSEEMSSAPTTQTTLIDLSEPTSVSTTVPADQSGSEVGVDSGSASGAASTSTTSPAADDAGSGAAGTDATTYTVKPGDSPYSIARQFGVSTASLMEANDIADPRVLRPGTVLSIPAD